MCATFTGSETWSGLLTIVEASMMPATAPMGMMNKGTLPQMMIPSTQTITSGFLI